MEMGNISIKMVKNTKDLGKMEKKLVKVHIHGKMVMYIKVNFKMIDFTDPEISILIMILNRFNLKMIFLLKID